MERGDGLTRYTAQERPTRRPAPEPCLNPSAGSCALWRVLASGNGWMRWFGRSLVAALGVEVVGVMKPPEYLPRHAPGKIPVASGSPIPPQPPAVVAGHGSSTE